MQKDKIDMWTEMFGNDVTMRQAAQMMNDDNVKKVYEMWLQSGKNRNIALGYIFGRSAALMEQED